MSITGTATRWSYAPNGVTTSFPYDNLILAASDLAVSWYEANGTPRAVPAYSVSGVELEALMKAGEEVA